MGVWGWEGENSLGWVGKNYCSKENGGLRVKDVFVFNFVRLAKWRWNLFHNRGKLWEMVLDFNYSDWEGLCDVGITSKESIWRRGIKRVCERDDDRWFDDMV